jgi:hypothetical protein
MFRFRLHPQPVVDTGRIYIKNSKYELHFKWRLLIYRYLLLQVYYSVFLFLHVYAPYTIGETQT